MTEEVFYQELKKRFRKVLTTAGLTSAPVQVTCRALSPEEAIGRTKRQDFPILTGRDVMIQAQFGSSRGQAFTDAPAAFQGSLSDVLGLDIVSDAHSRSLFIAVLNAVMQDLERCRGTVHCRGEGPELCAGDMRRFLQKHYGDRRRILLVGYQPSLLEMLHRSGYEVRVMDLNPENIGQERYGVTVEHGIRDREDAVDWAELILCTGSTVCNGTIVDYLDLQKEVLFFGITIAGTATLMHLHRVCFAERYC